MVGISMGWRHLLFANWAVEPETVARHLPEGLSVDTHDGKAWLSVVAFENVDMRPRGFPSAVGVDLPELNLRTYVTAPGHDRPGIFFYNLDADKLLAALGGRLAFGLPYYNAHVRLDESDGRVRFTSRRAHPGAQPLEFEARYEPTGPQFRPEPGSRAEFLTMRFRLYTVSQRGSVCYVDVDHEPWPLHPAEAAFGRNDAFRAHNFETPEDEPICYYSPGVDVTGTLRRCP